MGSATTASLDLASKRALLSRIFVFSGLAEKELDLIADCAVVKRFPARTEVCRKAANGTEAYAIVSGRVKATTESVEGKEIVLSIMEPGEVFGEVAMLCGGRRSATATTLEPTELLVLHRRELLRVFEQHTSIATSCLAALAERLVRITETVEDFVFLGLPSRLAKRLLALADSFGESAGDDVRIDLRLSQGELAGMVATSRESVNKQLKAWEREGIVSHARGEVVIHDRSALEGLAELVTI